MASALQDCPHGMGVDCLITELDKAVASDYVHIRCERVAEVLSEACRGELNLPCVYTKPDDGKYARRLLHRDPSGLYSVVVMVWDGGQGTPVHDHAGHWCVECVYKGHIQVTSYDLVEAPENDRVRFKREDEVDEFVGASGALIPPFEYHVIRNPEPKPAVTIHVYGGELTGCHTFLPMPGGDLYRREWHASWYTA